MVVLALFERRRQARRNAELAVEAKQSRELAESYAREVELRQELTDTVHQSIEVAIVACDQDGHLTLFNRAAREWHGLEPDAGLDPSLWAKQYDLYAADAVTLLQPDQVPLYRALHDGAVRDVEMVIAPAGRPARDPCAVHRQGIQPRRWTPLGAVVTMTDVTIDRAQSAQLADREALMTAVLDTALDAFITAGSTGSVTAWNPAAATMFGWTPDEARGRPLTDLIIRSGFAGPTTMAWPPRRDRPGAPVRAGAGSSTRSVKQCRRRTS